MRPGGGSLGKPEEISEDWRDSQGVPILGDIAGCLSFRGGGCGAQSQCVAKFSVARVRELAPNFSGWALEGEPGSGRLRGEERCAITTN